MRSFLEKLSLFQKIQLGLVLLLLLGLPLFFFVSQLTQDVRQRASTDTSQEIESGLVTGTATIRSDAGASGGKYVRFGQNL
jgi:hypothetical protein